MRNIHSPAGAFGSFLQFAALLVIALANGFALTLSLENGMPRSLLSPRGFTVLAPAVTTVLALVLAVRLAVWFVRAVTATGRHFALFRRGLPAQLLFSIMGVGLGLGAAMLGGERMMSPIALVIALTALGFLANPHVAIFDGDGGHVRLSGFLWGGSRPLSELTLAPVVERSRNTTHVTTHLGVVGPRLERALTDPLPPMEIASLAQRVAQATGVATA